MNTLPFAVQMTRHGKPSLVAAFANGFDADDYAKAQAVELADHCRGIGMSVSIHETNGDFSVAHVVNTEFSATLTEPAKMITTIYETITLPVI